MADVVGGDDRRGLPLCRRVSAPRRAVLPVEPRRPRQGGSPAPRRTLRPRLAAAPARARGLGARGQRRRDQRHPAADRAADRHRPCRRVHHDHRHLRRHRRQASAAPAPCISSRRSIWRPSSAAFSPTGARISRSSSNRRCGRPWCASSTRPAFRWSSPMPACRRSSFRGWRRFAGFAGTVFPRITLCLAQSDADATRFSRARRAQRAHRRQPQVRRSAACRRQRRRRPPDRRPSTGGRCGWRPPPTRARRRSSPRPTGSSASATAAC